MSYKIPMDQLHSTTDLVSTLLISTGLIHVSAVSWQIDQGLAGQSRPLLQRKLSSICLSYIFRRLTVYILMAVAGGQERRQKCAHTFSILSFASCLLSSPFVILLSWSPSGRGSKVTRQRLWKKGAIDAGHQYSKYTTGIKHRRRRFDLETKYKGRE